MAIAPRLSVARSNRLRKLTGTHNLPLVWTHDTAHAAMNAQAMAYDPFPDHGWAQQAGVWKHLESHHTEQYRKAWFAGFPPNLWPAEEEEDGSGRIFLRLKDGSKILATG